MPLAAFHPVIARWFAERLGEPTPAQRLAWPAIRRGGHVLLAAPTGSGKTLAAFLHALDALVRQGPDLPSGCSVLYVSPLRALSNDIRANLLVPLAGIAAMDPALPTIRAQVRTGDTTASERQKMVRTPPHILVTTPETLGILLCSASGRGLLGGIRTVIVDEIHAVAGNKRGAHLALALERLEHLVREAGHATGPQRIGISATQKPLEGIAALLGGVDRAVDILDAGHLRQLDLGVMIPDAPLEAVVSHATWDVAHGQLLDLARQHRTTLVFVSTRALAERLSRRLIERLDAAGEPGAALVACHHGSLSKERRLDAEGRLKRGELRVLVATATLELGIDIGDVDLVVQIGSPRSIATFLQRAGRAGHGPDRVPRARLLALTPDELIEGAALLRAVRERELDAIAIPAHPWDVLAQHVVAACAAQPWHIDALRALLCRAAPYREVDAERFARVVDLHARGRHALLHLDPATGMLRGTRRARLTAVTSGGAIADAATMQVRQDPEDLLVGTLHEDFAMESSPGDIFQLGNTSWRILRVEGRAGVVRVQDARGAPPTIPFWLGEAPGRTRELSQAVGRLRDEADGAQWFVDACGLDQRAAQAAWEVLEAARASLGQLPTHRRVVAERFFDENGNQHLVIHACFGARINRAWGLALRKRFCTGFGFELEAAATDEGILLSLGPAHSFTLEDVFAWLSPATLRATLLQACLTGGQFQARWRWAAAIAMLIERARPGGRVPPFLLRIRADDSLLAAFPAAQACAETLPPGPVAIPEEHPIVAQTVADLLTELLDHQGLAEVLGGLREGAIAVHCVDVPEPSPLARSIVAARPYAFLDDTPFEERRTRAIAPPASRVQALPADGIPPEVAEAVRAAAWPDPRDGEELHEALCWMGFATGAEARASGWEAWLAELAATGRVEHADGDRWYATGTSRDPLVLWRGRLEVVGAVASDDAELLALEHEGLAMRVRIAGEPRWCHRRLVQRMLMLAREQRRAAFRPVSAAAFWRFLGEWQGVAPTHRRSGTTGLADTLRQLAGLELPAAHWHAVLAARVQDLRPDFLDQLTSSGEFAWGRLWGPAEGGGARRGTIRATPVAFVPRADLDTWLALAGPAPDGQCSGTARAVLDLLHARGAHFVHDLASRAHQPPAMVEDALAELVALGLVTCDSSAGLRWLLLPADRRKRARPPAGRWDLLRTAGAPAATAPGPGDEAGVQLVARTLLARTGVAMRATWDRERIRCRWRDLLSALRLMELRGECVGGRFVAGFSGEQFALPEAARALARRDDGAAATLSLSALDPLNYSGLIVHDTVRAVASERVVIAAR